MAKAKTEKTETKTKAAAGSSIPAQSKNLVMEIYADVAANDATQLEDTGNFLVEISKQSFDWLMSLGEQLKDTLQRGLPAEMKLEKLQEERNAIYRSMQGRELVDGKLFTDEENEKITNLSVQIDRLKKAIAKKATADAETDSDEENE